MGIGVRAGTKGESLRRGGGVRLGARAIRAVQPKVKYFDTPHSKLSAAEVLHQLVTLTNKLIIYLLFVFLPVSYVVRLRVAADSPFDPTSFSRPYSSHQVTDTVPLKSQVRELGAFVSDPRHPSLATPYLLVWVPYPKESVLDQGLYGRRGESVRAQVLVGAFHQVT